MSRRTCCSGDEFAPFSSDLRGNLEHPDIGEDTTIQKFHDVEWSADNGAVLTENYGLGYWYLLFAGSTWVGVVLVQGRQDFVFALYLVSGGGQKLTGWLFAKHKTLLAAKTELGTAFEVG